MHIEGPWLSTTGKKKGKTKFRNSKQAATARQLDEDWKNLMAKYEPKKAVAPAKKTSLSESYKLTVPAGRTTQYIPSLSTGLGNATLAPAKVYTGTKVKGIATMHKSNAVPVFSDEEAVEISRMRR